jgi:hypothetical protein
MNFEPGKKIDVVYPMAPVAKGPDDFELRYSLRSFDSQTWAGNVFTVGYRPRWLKNAQHIDSSDQWHQNFKDKNIIKKMLRACVDGRVSDPFVANSDDQYWLKPIGPDDMLIPPRENPAQMDVDRASKIPGQFRAWRNQWVKRQFETIDFLKKQGKSDIPFDGHVPYLIDKESYLRTMAEIPWEMGNGFLIVVYHGYNWQNGFPIESRDGVLKRIITEMNCAEIEGVTGKALFLNHNNKGLGPGMREFLKKRFPNPSRWE